mmetsp:Transcript_51124/g.81135  ORF Transcript_51124/g.81135 Transcript_51124/m.81135 type:complete len:799 (+) Transcript_51124:96-2492(+)
MRGSMHASADVITLVIEYQDRPDAFGWVGNDEAKLKKYEQYKSRFYQEFTNVFREHGLSTAFLPNPEPRGFDKPPMHPENYYIKKAGPLEKEAGEKRMSQLYAHRPRLRYPRLGSFEVSIRCSSPGLPKEFTIWSKLESRLWPNVKRLVSEAVKLFNNEDWDRREILSQIQHRFKHKSDESEVTLNSTMKNSSMNTSIPLRGGAVYPPMFYSLQPRGPLPQPVKRQTLTGASQSQSGQSQGRMPTRPSSAGVLNRFRGREDPEFISSTRPARPSSAKSHREASQTQTNLYRSSNSIDKKSQHEAAGAKFKWMDDKDEELDVYEDLEPTRPAPEPKRPSPPAVSQLPLRNLNAKADWPSSPRVPEQTKIVAEKPGDHLSKADKVEEDDQYSEEAFESEAEVRALEVIDPKVDQAVLRPIKVEHRAFEVVGAKNDQPRVEPTKVSDLRSDTSSVEETLEFDNQDEAAPKPARNGSGLNKTSKDQKEDDDQYADDGFESDFDEDLPKPTSPKQSGESEQNLSKVGNVKEQDGYSSVSDDFEESLPKDSAPRSALENRQAAEQTRKRLEEETEKARLAQVAEEKRKTEEAFLKQQQAEEQKKQRLEREREQERLRQAEKERSKLEEQEREKQRLEKEKEQERFRQAEEKRLKLEEEERKKEEERHRQVEKERLKLEEEKKEKQRLVEEERKRLQEEQERARLRQAEEDRINAQKADEDQYADDGFESDFEEEAPKETLPKEVDRSKGAPVEVSKVEEEDQYGSVSDELEEVEEISDLDEHIEADKQRYDYAEDNESFSDFEP